MSEIKLKGIVQKMIDAGESDELIKEVITKYRTQNTSTAQADFADDREAEVKEEPSQTDATVEEGDTASSGEDSSLVYEYRTEGNKAAWGKSTDAGKTFEVVSADDVPADWYEDPKFKEIEQLQKLDKTQKVEEKKDLSKTSTLLSNLSLGFVEFAKGFENIKEGVQLGVAELLMPGEMSGVEKKTALQAIRKTNVFGNSESYDPIINKLEENIPEYETKSITEDLQKGNYAQAGFRTVNAALRSAPSLVAAATGVGGLIALGSSVAGNKFEEEFEANPEKSTGILLANAGVTGATEATFELVTRGLLKRAGFLKNTGRVKEAKEVIRGGVGSIIKNIGFGLTAEGSSEAATELTVAFEDYIMLDKEVPFKDLKYRLGDAFIVGSFIGGSISSVGEVSKTMPNARNRAEAILMPEDAKKEIIKKSEELNELIDDLPNVSPEGKGIVNDKINEIENEIIDIRKKSSSLINNLKGEDLVNYSKNIKEVNDVKNVLKNAKTDSEKNIAEQKYKILQDQNVSILKNAKSKATEAVTETVRQAIKQSGLEGNVTEMTSEEIANIKQEGFDSKEAAKQFGFIAQNTDGSFNITLNKDKPMVGTAAHEFMHAVLFKTLGNQQQLQDNLGDALVDHVKDLGGETSVLGERLKAYGRFNKDGVFERDANFGEETITIMSEEIINGNLKFNENFFTKIGDIVRRFSQNYLGKEITFDTGRDVYNFVKDYSKSIKDGKINKAILKVAKQGAKGKLVEGKVTPEATVQMSKDASDNVQRIYEEQGEAGIFDILNEFKPIVGKIVQKRSEAPNFDRQLLTDEIETGKRGILDLVREYKPDSGVPLAAYINKFLPARAIEASQRVLGEEFTEDVTEKVDIAAEEVTTETKTKPKPKKIVLADRLGVTEEVAKAIKKLMPKIDFNKETFKSLKNQIPKITGEIFGISPKKLVSGANITKGELQSAQMFINKNADVLISMLPEGATAGGTATGVPQTLLKAFYTKTDRAKMAKTGTKAGLAIQVKNDIKKADFLETFGIIDGKPVRTDRNTSARVLALANQTGKMMTNQAVRQSLISDGKTVGEITSLSDGKAKIMFSKTGKKKVTSPIKSASQKLIDTYTAKYDDMVKVAGIDIDTGELKLKPIDLKTEDGRQEYIGFIVEVLAPIFPKKVLLAMSGSFARGDSAIEKANKNKFLFQNKEQFEIFLETLEATGIVFGENMTVENQNDILNAIKREGYGKATSKTQNKKMKDKDLKASKKRGFKLIWETIQNNIQEDQRTIPGFALMLSSSSKFQGHFTRTGAVIDFINTLTGKNREEHTSPITGLGKYFFLHAVIGDLFTGGKNSIFENATKSYFQGSLPVFMDNRLKLKGVYDYSSLPPVELLQGILDGDISIWARYFHPNVNSNFTTDFDSMSAQDIANGEHLIGGINPNVIKLANGNTIAQEFGVSVNVKITPQIAAAQQNLIYRIAIGEKISDSKIKSVLNAAVNLKIKPQLKETKILNKSIAFSRSAKNESKGITVLDFDDTLATTKSLVKFTRPDGTTGTLNAEEYASTYQDLLDQGFTFDFSEFNKVVKGKIAPLFQKALKLQGKFGPENMFVLTARPPAAQQAIFDFLKANGLNIPIKNITGLGNSTSEAKALWISDKVSDGYNDFYFADDALQNVQAVKNMLDQFDVKSKVQQARVKFSKDMNTNFNNILEEVTGIESIKRFAATKARKRGADKGKFRFFIPPSHEDFVGLLYNFIGKGRQGDGHRDFFEQSLIRPLNRANREYDTARQSIANDYKALNKQFADIRKKLTKKTPDGDFTFQDAIRVYLWNKHGHSIPGLSEIDQANLSELVMSDPSLQAYAETLNTISKQETYINPTDGWESGDIRVDLDDATGRVGRDQYFSEFNENTDVIFSEENLNKIEAGYGKGVREALEDMLYRIKTGRNRPTGQNRIVNGFMNYLNGSVGTVMFFNMRSALLQQMSLVNYINFADNNIFAAAKAFANQKQYWKDFAFIFNSDMLKQRRGGIQTDVNGAELAESLRNSRNPTRKLISKLLELGFLPTQIGDNIAIATGGAPYYRNRINKYIKDGLSQKEAESAAFTDFQNLTQSTQQSARPDMVSQQQASVIGKVILNFQNVTSQFNRLGKKAFQDIYNRRITQPNTTQMQSDISNAARITYYFAVQNAIFYTLQTALFAMLFDDDEEDDNKLFLKKKERLINGSIDSVLRGSGVLGAVVSTLKNVAIAFARQRDVNYNPDESAVLMEALNLSPVLGIKGRKITNAEKTLNYNKSIIEEMSTFDIDNPQWSATTNYVEMATNVPLNRLYNKTQNVRQALNNEHSTWERTLMFLGWSQYNLNLENKKMDEVKETVKEKKKIKSKEKAKIKKEEKKKQREEENKAVIEENKKKSKKDGICSAVSMSGKRCKREAVNGGFCTVHEKAEKRSDGKQTQCRKRKSNGERCKMQTASKSGYCYYHD